jgi:hypothetical protein
MGKPFFRLVTAFRLDLLIMGVMLMGCVAAPAATPTAPVAAVTATQAVPTITATTQATTEPTVQPTNQPTNSPTASPLSPTATIAPTTTTTLTPGPLPEGAAAPATPASGAPAEVAFIKDGDVQLWHEATQQSETIFSAGDAAGVWVSDDGQLIAFLRRWVEQIDDLNWFEQTALWVVDRNGENAREVISAEDLRQRLNAGAGESTTIAQIEWLPQTHHLVYSGMRYSAQGEGTSHALPEGVYLVDTETLSDTVLAPAGNYLRFALAPDGRQIALMSTTALSFINVDGSNWRQDILTYPQVGVPVPLLPTGVWTQDGRAFLMVTPIESESEFGLNYTIMRVPIDGSAAQPLATIASSHSGTVVFSPDGQRVAFYQWQPISDWFITPLAASVGPLAIPYAIDLSGYANLHWSPAGAAFVVPDIWAAALFQLCPDATQGSEVCGAPVNLEGAVLFIRWIDSARFLFTTEEPKTLFLGRLDGTRIPIATWSPEEPVSFTPVVTAACMNDSAFVLDVNVPDGTHVAPGASFTKTWRLRNSGTCTWDASYRFNFVSGEQMNGLESIPMSETVLPGGEVDISVELIAPGAEGTYRGQWQLIAPDETPFGAKPYVEVVVP